VILTAVSTGLRLGELLGLQWHDVDLDGRVLNVRRQWARTNEYAEPKTEAALRRVPLSNEMTQFLRRRKEAAFGKGHASPEHPVFASRNGKALQHRNVTRRGFEPAAKHAEIHGVTFHSLRHAFASRMIHRGIEPVRLAKLLGHEDARMTLQRYAHLYEAQRGDDLVREAMAW
jgi:integrase